MVAFNLYDKDPNEIIEIVRTMRDSGMIQGKDFDFAYNQSRWDPMIGDIKGFTKFTFYTEKKATMFALKWGAK
jgi:hypothetical protein